MTAGPGRKDERTGQYDRPHGGNLNLELGAESIESRRRRERLVQLRCSLGQECLYSTAVPLDHAGALLSTFVPSH